MGMVPERGRRQKVMWLYQIDQVVIVIVLVMFALVLLLGSGK